MLTIRAVRERFDRPEHLLSLAAGRNAIREVVEEALQKPSRRRRSRVMRYLEGGPSVNEQPAERSPDETAVPSPDDRPASETPNVEEPSSASGAAPIDTEEIDVSDWEVAAPDL
jgi:hypothetical protein